MTIWVPDLGRYTGPAYLAIADALGDAIRRGELRPGDQLPTHRLLSDLLGLNVSTITRAYQEAARRRLLGGEVGRGSYVLGLASESALFSLQDRPEGGFIDLSTNRPPILRETRELGGGEQALDVEAIDRCFHYPGPGDIQVHLQAAARWLARRGVQADPASILLCAGAQHAMDTAIGLFPEAEELACEALVYPGLKAAARHARRRLHGLPMDAEGVLPEALDAAGRAGLRLAVLSPTLHNPTTGTMGDARRRRIAEIARKRDLLVVEEDVYGHLADDAPPPLAALAPERVIYLTGLSKTVAPGLRIGYLVLPEVLHERMRDAIHHSSWYVSPLTMALASRWLEDGTALRRLRAQQRELAARHRICRELLGGFRWRGVPHCPHVWIQSPAGGAEAFCRRARQAGVGAVASSVFSAGRPQAEEGLRICMGAAPDRATLREGLERLARTGVGGFR